ncbi:MAG: D-alanine--D-alanine ligase [Defluviitaleaceae bacterium]|nr:D-alanine--D-alanine ligase [Defluviitaleaceae bacterium]MCL2835535.1 D-alanine--D-alanine ligase [Defluviitaleaceae bacterium]
MNKPNDDRTKVAVLLGGRGAEHEVSIQSGRAIIAALLESRDKYEVLPVYITKDGQWLLHENASGLDTLEHTGAPVAVNPGNGFMLANYGFTPVPADAVFPALHGEYGEDGTIQGLCELAGLPCVGSGMLSSAMCLDKPVSKRLAAGIGGLFRVPFLEFNASDPSRFEEIAAKVRDALGYPCFVKPVNTGSSCGISKAVNGDGLFESLRLAAGFAPRIIVEAAVKGRELEVGVLGNDSPVASGVGEIITSHGFYDYDSKYTEGAAEVVVSADIDKNIAESIRYYALEVYKIMGCRGMARVDFFLENGTNRVLFNEINTIPGFTPTSMYPKLFEHEGIPMARLVDKLVELAIEGRDK